MRRADPVPAQVRAFWAREGLEPGSPVICGVSGGADSMALLWCLHTLFPGSVTAAHFNHRLRGPEADRDEAFVRDFCAARAIPFVSGRGDAAARAAREGETLEEAARALRYDFLLSLPGGLVATAHQAEDNAETVLMHLLRGTGLRGLGGIAPRRDRLIRPLLGLTRRELRDYLVRENIPWVEDSTNEEDTCTRNRIRHRVLPLLEAEAPRFCRNLEARGRLLRQEDAYLDGEARALLEAAQRPGGLSCTCLREAHPVPARRALRLWLRPRYPQNLSLAHVEALLKLAAAPAPSGSVTLPGGLRILRAYDLLAPEPRKPQEEFVPVPLAVPGTTVIGPLQVKITCTLEKKPEKTPNLPFQFWADCAIIKENCPLVRPRRRGDRMALPGGGHTTLKRLCIARRIPAQCRDSLPVLAAGEAVLGVGGLGGNPEFAPKPGEPGVKVIIETIEKEEE